MRNIKLWLLSCITLGMFTAGNAHINPELHKKTEGASSSDASGISYRENCDNAVARVDMAINNVRARLTTGGDVWWDGNTGQYVVPKVEPGSGIEPVSSIFAGAVWIGGLDPTGETLKIAAQTYGRGSGQFDFWPGPLVPEGPDVGTVEQQTCSDWDRFFTVRAKSIDLHKAQFEEAKTLGTPYDENMIPEDLKGWPATGNPYFFDIHEFDLPNTDQGLAGFHDYNDDLIYNPIDGDYPIIEIRGCPDLYYGDEMTFWIYNDAGNSHAETNSADRLQMEIQVQAFAYSTSDEINNMTFQRYKLINRAVESLDSTYFAMWMDPDLGCHTDDYIGCDTTRSLAYVYNSDAVDGSTPGSCNCEQGTNTYCEEIPILGLDYFRGPLDENFNEIGMSSFTYYNNGSIGGPAPGTTDPETADEYYNYMRGLWRDGSPFQYGDDAYQVPGGESIKYAFTEAPNDPTGWSMYQANVPVIGDRRTVQASGPFRLDPGAVNELIVGAVWVPNQSYPGPSIKKLQEADDIAQKLFDECFKIPNGPDAPDVDFIELDQEIIMVLSNNENRNISNNTNESYKETGLDIPALELDSLYFFEGYRIFQVSGPGIDLSKENRGNLDKVRIYAEVNAKNGVAQLFNWRGLTEDETPIETGGFEAEGQLAFPLIDDGVRHTFRIKEDLFSKGDGRLINHKKYYYIVVAYGYNNYENFDPAAQTGQRKPYFEGRRNIGPIGDGKPYTVIPRPITDRGLNAGFGDGAIITRIDGIGTGTNFLDLSDETRAAIESNITDGTALNPALTYKAGRGPIDILVYNPLDVKDGEFELTFVDENMGNNKLDAAVYWQLTNLTDPSAPVILSDTSINKLNEQIIKEFGFSISIGQVANVGSQAEEDPLNGYIGYEEEYANGEDAAKWLNGIPDGVTPNLGAVDQLLFDYVQNAPGQEYSDDDPEQVFTKVGPGYFTPYYLCNYKGNEGIQEESVITPAWTASSETGPNLVHGQTKLDSLNNVDIVFTSDKSLWSRCIIVETANVWLTGPEGEQTANYWGDVEDGKYNKSMDIKTMPSVTKDDNDGDGSPDIDTNVTEGVDDYGYGWFPGYAVDVETGQRLNIFFGENSVYDGSKDVDSYESKATGNDMMFNPTSQFFLATGGFATAYNYMAGAHHFIYVTKQPYDGCNNEDTEKMHPNASSALQKFLFIKEITWAGFLMPNRGLEMLSYKEGLIREDVTVKLRVNDNYQVKVGTNDFNGYPTYRFKLEGLQADELDEEGIETALDLINVVPNPYYGFSDYENSQFDTNIKVTNLPPQCVITIYSLDGKFIRQYNRDEIGANAKGAGINKAQVNPDVIWDLKNNKGIPVASGVYLIHVAAEGLGERTLKWFGVNRQFDPSGL